MYKVLKRKDTDSTERDTDRDDSNQQMIMLSNHLISRHWAPQTEHKRPEGSAAVSALQCQLRQSVDEAVDVLEPMLQELKDGEG